MTKEKHVVLEELLRSIRNDWNDAACEKAELIFNIQEADIDKLFKENKILKTEYETLLIDCEHLTDIPSVEFNGQKFNAEAVEILFEQQEAAGRQLEACCDELDEKDAMIDAMIEGFNLRNRIHYDTYSVGDYDWSLIMNRIKMSEPDERLVRIEQVADEVKQLTERMEEELTLLKNEIRDE